MKKQKVNKKLVFLVAYFALFSLFQLAFSTKSVVADSWPDGQSEADIYGGHIHAKITYVKDGNPNYTAIGDTITVTTVLEKKDDTNLEEEYKQSTLVTVFPDKEQGLELLGEPELVYKHGGVTGNGNLMAPSKEVAYDIITAYNFYGLLMLLILLNEKKEEYYQIYLESMKKNEEYYQKLEEFRHDYKNYVGVMEDLVQNKQIHNEIEAIVGEEKEFFETQLNDALHMKLQKIYDLLLQGVFVKFVKRAEELRIPYKIQVNHIIPKLSMNSYDMIRLFTNIIENAFVHYDQTMAKEKKEITIIVEHLWDCFYFEFSNPSKNTGKNLTELFQKGTTSQKSSKGIGLYSVKKIVEENENLALNLKYDKQEQRFYCILTLKKETVH